jgi:hypothetical protein
MKKTVRWEPFFHFGRFSYGLRFLEAEYFITTYVLFIDNHPTKMRKVKNPKKRHYYNNFYEKNIEIFSIFI